MTATPIINQPSDIATLINIIAVNEHPMLLPINKSKFDLKYNTLRGRRKLEKILKKYVSFYIPERDKSDYPRKREKVMKIQMSKEQKDAYFDAETKSLKKKTLHDVSVDVNSDNIDKPTNTNQILLNRFLSATRQISNTVKGKENSPKIKAIAKYISEHSLPAVVYSNFMDNGLKPLNRLLKKNGFKTETFTGDLNPKKRKAILTDYNNKKIDVLLISSAGAEGLDLKRTRQIHVMEPHWNDPKIRQVVGRAIRYRSHFDLPENQKRVDVVHWISTIPGATRFAKQVAEKKEKLKSKKKTSKRKKFSKRKLKSKNDNATENNLGISADEFLHNMSMEKRKKNKKYLEILKKVSYESLSGNRNQSKKKELKKSKNKTKKRIQKGGFVDNYD